MWLAQAAFRASSVIPDREPTFPTLVAAIPPLVLSLAQLTLIGLDDIPEASKE